MALYHLLFTAYFIAFCWLLTRLPFIKNTGLGNKLTIALFAVKVVAGISIGWASLHLYGPGNDYWDINHAAWDEYQLLRSDPGKYFTGLFSSGYADGYSGVFSSFNSFWNDLRNNVVIKFISVFNIFSQGHYYINSLFFNFIIFFGHVALYRLFKKIFKGQDRLLIIPCFLLPSLLYFSSGIHKDGIVFLLLVLLCVAVFSSLQKRSFSGKAIVAVLLCMGILFVVRNFVLVFLGPALIAWILASKSKRPLWQVFGGVYLVSGLLFFSIHQFIPAVDPLKILVQRQSDFLQIMPSRTDIHVDRLQRDVVTVVGNAPQAFGHLLLRPYLWDTPLRSLLPFAMELLCYQFLFILFLFFRKKNDLGRDADIFLYFCIFFGLTAFLFIGYIVPNIGSLIRYRSLYLPFLITPIICGINWDRVKGIIKKRIVFL